MISIIMIMPCHSYFQRISKIQLSRFTVENTFTVVFIRVFPSSFVALQCCPHLHCAMISSAKWGTRIPCPVTFTLSHLQKSNSTLVHFPYKLQTFRLIYLLRSYEFQRHSKDHATWLPQTKDTLERSTYTAFECGVKAVRSSLPRKGVLLHNVPQNASQNLVRWFDALELTSKLLDVCVTSLLTDLQSKSRYTRGRSVLRSSWLCSSADRGIYTCCSVGRCVGWDGLRGLTGWYPIPV